MNILYLAADEFCNAAEFVAENVPLGELQDRAVQEVKIGAPYGAASHFEDDVSALDDFRFRDLGCSIFVRMITSPKLGG